MEAYNNTESMELSDVLAQISGAFKTEKERIDNNSYVYFDTFDWRLYKNNLFLTKNTHCYALSKLSNKEPFISLTVCLKKNFSFWWDFPDSDLKIKLKNLIGVRALIPLTTVECKNQVFRLLNKDEKTVARITFRKIKRKGSTRKEINLIYLNPIRGYHKEFKSVKSILLAIGLKPNSQNILSISLLETDVKPGSYTGKLDIKLKPEMTAQQGAVLIFSKLLSTMEQNEEGIKKDIDTEFLHDFRVAVRRTRSALSQIKAVFSEEITNRAKQEFSSLGKMTNCLRDLDVYLLKKERYIQMLPHDLRPGAEPIFKKLETERREEQKKLAEYLNSQSYTRIIAFWKDFLESRNLENVKSQDSDISVIEMAKKFILKKYKRIIKIGKLINEKTKDDDIHSLRIECKKLRYLLEFFSSLFPRKEMVLITNQLKKLQDNLGDFNDLYVQQESLKDFLDKVYNDKDKKIVTLAVGGLIGVLYQKQQELKKQFAQKFEEFSREENIRLYDKLFS